MSFCSVFISQIITKLERLKTFGSFRSVFLVEEPLTCKIVFNFLEWSIPFCVLLFSAIQKASISADQIRVYLTAQ